jgi:hypothetical protein
VAAGVRFQGRTVGRVRLFADAGGGFGHSRYEGGSRVTATNHLGVAAAVGTTIRFDRFYTRATAQLMVLSGYYVAARATVGAGWRF